MPPVNILYAEDFQPVKLIVKETLELEGWRVEDCDDGLTALGYIESRAPYDLILLDDDLPGLTGIELVARARSLEHRRHTPVVMLSATERRCDARTAGVNIFLKKPEGMTSLVETIKQLLREMVEKQN
ncbi:MAG: two-component system, chemotaxis family, chemotaxis protein CheY [Pyrinomonadaceae bacterium]|jgi:DNA-binding response OmpR family regulator|nr:two-component system, chemotaxis family, chemotaxis protein CheY [Pyrinomonadaceae bacterium]